VNLRVHKNWEVGIVVKGVLINFFNFNLERLFGELLEHIHELPKNNPIYSPTPIIP
jgi:hypothetical protein